MNEEKIIDYLKEIIQEIEYRHKDGELILVNDTTTDKLYYSIKGLLDLYNKEIQRNKDLEQIEKEHKEENGRLREELENIEYIKRNFDYCLERKTKELEEENRIQRGQLNSAFNNGFIHKDKIKEIMDLYNNTLQCTRKYNEELANILCDLEELLEESEK